MNAPKFAPAREDGLFPYVVTTSQFGHETHDIKWAESLSAAKAEFGWTRMLYTRVTVRRAKSADLELFQ